MQINFSVKQQIITAECPGRLVIAGSQGHVYAQFSLDEEWDGLTVTALFSNDYVPTGARSVVLTGNKPVEIPPEVLATGKLRASLVGVRDEGEYRLTTKFMDKPILVVRSGATSGDASNQSPELWEQALALMGDLGDLPTSDKSSLVAAISEVFLSGGSGSATTAVSNHNSDTEAHPDIRKVVCLLSAQKADKDQGAANAGKLLYVGTDGLVAPLTLGNGLQIVNGVLTITGQPSTPEEAAIAFIDNGDGSATVQGVTFEDQGNGVVLMRGYKNSEVTA